MGMGFTPTVPAFPDEKASLIKSLVSRSRCEMYVAIEGLLSAEAAPFLLRLSDSLKGEVPMVVPAVFESTCLHQLSSFESPHYCHLMKRPKHRS
jgi:hypothetical protein